MLLILYGSTAEMGHKSRDYLVKAGYSLINKLNYNPTDHETIPLSGEREYVSKEEFYSGTDSLFRYEFNGIQIGFNQEQILAAVSNQANCLLTLSTTNIKILSEIKRVHGDNVKIIFTYIDDSTLESIFRSYDRSEDEIKMRISVGKALKESYAQNAGLFDYVVMYGGEDSVFNYEKMYRQYDRIIEELRPQEVSSGEKQYDVFISYAHRDNSVAEGIYRQLSQNGISVFYDMGLAIGSDWSTQIRSIIQKAKVVIAVISENSLKSECVKSEINLAIETADNNGTVVLPFFLNDNINLDDTGAMAHLQFLPCIINRDDIAESISQLVERIKMMFDGSETLKWLSNQVDDYIYLKNYEMAQKFQEEHYKRCEELYSLSSGNIISQNMLFNSKVKLISILIDREKWNDAIDEIISVFQMIDDDADYRLLNVIEEQLVLCCHKSGYSKATFKELIDDSLRFAMICFPELSDELMDKYEAFGSIEKKIDDSEGHVKDDKLQIANYGEMAIGIFEELLKTDLTDKKRESLKSGYERILNYCKYMGLNDAVAEKCVGRIAELNRSNDKSDETESGELFEALKIYLGQALPKSGDYDVFISYKSEDEVIAEKIYDYLRQNGKETFFASKTLPQLRDSEYEKAIYDAMERSKHMVLVGSDPEYFKTEWVSDEWGFYRNEKRKGRKKGNLVIVLADEYMKDDGKLPSQLRQTEIIPMSTFRTELLEYLW